MRTAVRRFGAADIAGAKTVATQHLERMAAGHHDSLLSRRTALSAGLPFCQIGHGSHDPRFAALNMTPNMTIHPQIEDGIKDAFGLTFLKGGS